MRLFSYRDLLWTGREFRPGKHGRVQATIEPDADWPNLYRVRLPDGHLTDMVNLTRAKHAAIALALEALNRPTATAA
jgi:hypothetical protein